MLTAVLAACLLAAPVLSRTFLAVDGYSDTASCSSKGTIEATALTEVGVCFDVAMTLPSPLNAVKSFKIDSCANGAEFVSVKVEGFPQAGCSGIAIPYTFDDVIPAGCYENALASCQSDPICLSEGWPNMAVYINDDSCTNTVGVVAVKPGCDSYESGSYQYSLSTDCSDPASLHAVAYEQTLDCSGGAVLKDATVPTDTCKLYGEFPIPIPPLPVTHNVSVGDLLVGGYYKASCSGGY